jgi:cytochrome c oxidase subunit 4
MANARAEGADAEHAEHAEHVGHAEHTHVVVPVWKYLLIFVALLALTGATVGAAYVDLGALNNVVALGIALLKASLVVLYFMHVRYAGRLIPLAIVAGVFFLVHLIGGTMGDYITRGLLGISGTGR